MPGQGLRREEQLFGCARYAASLALLFNAELWWYLSGTVGPEVADRKTL